MKKKKNSNIFFSFLKFLITTAVIGFGIYFIKEYENTQDAKIEATGVPKFETKEIENNLKYYFISKQNNVNPCYNENTNYLSTLYQGPFSPEHKEKKETTETTLDLLKEIASKTTFKDENIKSEKNRLYRN